MLWQLFEISCQKVSNLVDGFIRSSWFARKSLSLFEGIYVLSIEAVASLRIGAFTFFGGVCPLGPPEWSLEVGRETGFSE
jgi:hypothetical protein